MNRFAPVFGLATMLVLQVPPASAGFTGATVSADYHWPDLGTVLYASGSAVVGPGVEFDNIGGFGVGTSPAVDFSDANILITYPAGWSLNGGGTFDGWVFTDLLAMVPTITGVSLAATNIPGFTAAFLSFDADHVYADQLGLGSWGPGSFISINVSFASTVPEPNSLLLIVAAGAMLAGTMRWRRVAGRET